MIEPLIPPGDRTTIVTDPSLNQARETRYQRRENRIYSINCRPNHDNDLDKVIIPYNFELQKYQISEEEISFYEKKDYLIETLEKFNQKNTFKIDKRYKPSKGQKLCLYAPALIISIALLYISVVLLGLFSFNPVLVYTFFSWGKKWFHYFKMCEFIFLEKFKIKEVKRILEEENNSTLCTENKLQWILGQSGYWLELKKNV